MYYLFDWTLISDSSHVKYKTKTENINIFWMDGWRWKMLYDSILMRYHAKPKEVYTKIVIRKLKFDLFAAIQKSSFSA